MSTKKLIPKIIARYNEGIKQFEIIKPNELKGVQVKLFTGEPTHGKTFTTTCASIRFADIKELIKAGTTADPLEVLGKDKCEPDKK